MGATVTTLTLTLPRPHSAQRRVLREARRFNVLVCGRRWGKTTLGQNLLTEPALRGQPVAYFAPTYKMLLEVWRTMVRVLKPVTARSNAQDHRIELVTGGIVDMWSLDSPDVARGRKYARVVIDEAAMIVALREAWEKVIRPTLVDFVGDAWFLSTPRGFNYYHDLFQRGTATRAQHPDWMAWQMPTQTNPHIRPSEVEAMRRELPTRVARQEIDALFEAENEGALWSRDWIDAHRVDAGAHPPLVRLLVALDPSGSKRGDEVGIIAAGVDAAGHGYVLDDLSDKLGPDDWATRSLLAYHAHAADCIVAEGNFGGDMVKSTIAAMGRELGIVAPVKLVTASRGKAVRAEPVAVLYKQGLVHHVGVHEALENELTMWTPLDAFSPGRLDAAVWALSELMMGGIARVDDDAALDMMPVGW